MVTAAEGLVEVPHVEAPAGAAELAGYGAGASNLAFPSAGRLFLDGGSRFEFEPRGKSRAWNPMVWEPSGFSSDTRLSSDAFLDLFSASR